jgi:hypothetical protein
MLPDRLAGIVVVASNLPKRRCCSGRRELRRKILNASNVLDNCKTGAKPGRNFIYPASFTGKRMEYSNNPCILWRIQNKNILQYISRRKLLDLRRPIFWKFCQYFRTITLRTCTRRSTNAQFRPFMYIHKYAMIIHMYINVTGQAHPNMFTLPSPVTRRMAQTITTIRDGLSRGMLRKRIEEVQTLQCSTPDASMPRDYATDV